MFLRGTEADGQIVLIMVSDTAGIFQGCTYAPKTHKNHEMTSKNTGCAPTWYIKINIQTDQSAMTKRYVSYISVVVDNCNWLSLSVP